MKKLVDPSTKHSTAFYAALGVTVYDLLTRGFHLWNTLLMALLAGVGTVGGLAALFSAARRLPGDGEDPPPGNPGV